MKLHASAPGRVCLFGEHQDYLGLPVAAAAIDLRCHVASKSREDSEVHVSLPDTQEEFRWDLHRLPELTPQSYLLSVLHVAREEGWLPKQGWNARVSGNIPINAGASSSTALTVAWTALVKSLSQVSQKEPMDQQWIARAAHRAEVIAFNESGGMMDHFACALGGVHQFEFTPEFQHLALPNSSVEWMLVDSLEPKETQEMLHRLKSTRVALQDDFTKSFSWHLAGIDDPLPPQWNEEQRMLYQATCRNRDLSSLGMAALQKGSDAREWGALMTNHHAVLSQDLHASTPAIDAVLKEAVRMGAYGGKINGSGGGGTLVMAIPSVHWKEVMLSVERAGMRPYHIHIGEVGVRVSE